MPRLSTRQAAKASRTTTSQGSAFLTLFMPDTPDAQHAILAREAETDVALAAAGTPAALALDPGLEAGQHRHVVAALQPAVGMQQQFARLARVEQLLVVVGDGQAISAVVGGVAGEQPHQRPQVAGGV